MKKDAKARRKKSDYLCRWHGNLQRISQPTNKTRVNKKLQQGEMWVTVQRQKLYPLQQQEFEINNALPVKLASEKMNYI